MVAEGKQEGRGGGGETDTINNFVKTRGGKLFVVSSNMVATDIISDLIAASGLNLQPSFPLVY